MTIDWQRFSERVPAGTRVRATEEDPLDDGLTLHEGDEGILMRHGREKEDSDGEIYWDDQILVQFLRLDDEWPMHPTCLMYLIGGVWHTFEELMQGDISRPSP